MNILRDVIQEKFHYVDRLVILDINLPVFINQGWIVFLTLHEMIRMRYLFRFVFGFCKAHGKVITKYVYMLKQRFYRFHFAYSRDNEKETKMMYIPYFLGLGILFCSVIIINFLF